MGKTRRTEQRPGRTLLAVLIASVLAACIAPPANAMASSEWSEASEIDDFVIAQRSAMRLPAVAVGVIADGELRYLEAYGDGAPGDDAMTSKTPFVLGSTSKQFTALAVHQLVAEGALAIEDTVGQVLGDLLPADGGAFSEVTVRELLSHRSGLAYTAGLAQWALFAPSATLEEHVRMLLATDPVARSGAAYEYSNANYSVLGEIVAHVRGEEFDVAMDALVFDPLGLISTTARPDSVRADSFYPWFGFANIITPQPAGAAMVSSAFMTSTADDLLQLLGAHIGSVDTAVPTAVLASAREVLGRAYGQTSAASGWMVRPFWELRDGRDGVGDQSLPSLWEHIGTTPRSMSYLAMQPDLGLGVVALTNAGAGVDQERMTVFSHRLLNAIAGTRPAGAVADPLVQAAPVLMLGLVLLLIAAIIWNARTIRRRTPKRGARVIPAAISTLTVGAALVFVFVVVPAQTQGGLFDTWWWVAVPDVAVSGALMLILSVAVLVTLARVLNWPRQSDARARFRR